MAPKTSNTTTPSKATNSPSSKATTPANSRPSTPVKTQTQSSDILANASEAVYQQALSASDTAAKTNLEKGTSSSHAFTLTDTECFCSSVINTSFPKARIIMGMDENSGQRFVRGQCRVHVLHVVATMVCLVYAAESYNVLAFMYASDIKGALTAVKTQLECVAKLKSGQNIPDGNRLPTFSSVQ